MNFTNHLTIVQLPITIIISLTAIPKNIIRVGPVKQIGITISINTSHSIASSHKLLQPQSKHTFRSTIFPSLLLIELFLIISIDDISLFVFKIFNDFDKVAVISLTSKPSRFELDLHFSKLFDTVDLALVLRINLIFAIFDIIPSIFKLST